MCVAAAYDSSSPVLLAGGEIGQSIPYQWSLLSISINSWWTGASSIIDNSVVPEDDLR